MWALINLVTAILLAYLLTAAYRKRAKIRRYRDALVAVERDRETTN